MGVLLIKRPPERQRTTGGHRSYGIAHRSILRHSGAVLSFFAKDLWKLLLEVVSSHSSHNVLGTSVHHGDAKVATKCQFGVPFSTNV